MNRVTWIIPLVVIALMIFGAGVASAASPPVATDDAYATNEDTLLSVAAPGVLGNDTDADGDTLSASLVSDVSNGMLTLNADGSFTYDPDPDYSGADSFTYVANDGSADSNVGTVSITVNPVNDPPVAAGDAYATGEDIPLPVAAPGVLDNDTDVEGDTLTAVLDTDVGNGTLVLNADGSFIYTPNLDFVGTDSFTYKANDGATDSGAATVTITVDNPPIATDDAYTSAENTVLSVAAPGVLGNDTDPEGDALSAVLDSGPSNGTLTLNSDGSFDYAPNLDFTGTDSFTYLANDGTEDSNMATVVITVGETDGTRKGFVGTVADGPGDICITKHGEDCQPITVPSGLTRIKTPSRKGEEIDRTGDGILAWIEEQEPKPIIVVLAERVGEEWVAVQILVKPDKAKGPKIGTVIEADEEGGQITIMTPKGKKHVVSLPEGEEPPGEGDVITVFEDPDDEDETEGGGPVKAKGLVNASQVRQRLEQHLAGLTEGDGEIPDEDAQLIDELAELLVNHPGRHLGMLKKIGEQDLPASTQEIINAALDETNNANQEAQATAAQAKEKAGPPEGRGKPENSGSNGKPEIQGATDDEEADEEDDGDDGGKPSNKGNKGKKPTGNGDGEE
jgi:VCBS repeat-containing protein